MGRKKKISIEEEVKSGLRRLAFGEITDAVTLLFAESEDILPEIPNLDLFNISEIKRPKGGGMEIKFFDRIKSLEKLREMDSAGDTEPVNFYKALEASVSKTNKVFGESNYE